MQAFLWICRHPINPFCISSHLPFKWPFLLSQGHKPTPIWPFYLLLGKHLSLFQKQTTFFFSSFPFVFSPCKSNWNVWVTRKHTSRQPSIFWCTFRFESLWPRLEANYKTIICWRTATLVSKRALFWSIDYHLIQGILVFVEVCSQFTDADLRTWGFKRALERYC